jgi:hypothetical protein
VAARVDAAQPASARSTTPPSSSDEGAGAGCSWWDPRSRSPSDGAPPRRRFRPRAGRKNQPLTPPVAPTRGRDLTPSPEPLPPPLRQKGAAFPARSAFPRRAARSVFAFASTSNADPPPCRGLCRPRPASDALSPLAADEEELDPAASAGSSPASARRHAPLVDFCNRIDPQARPRTDGTRPAISHPPLARRARTRSTVRLLLSERRSRGVTGQGLSDGGSRRAFPSASRRACARRELRPNPIGSDTSCRGPVLLPAGEAGSMRSDPPGDAPLSRCFAPDGALSLRRRQGRLPHPSAKRDTFRRTRGAFLCRTSPQGRALVSPDCPQPVDSGPGAFATPARSLPSTWMRREREGSTTFAGGLRRARQRRRRFPLRAGTP